MVNLKYLGGYGMNHHSKDLERWKQVVTGKSKNHIFHLNPLKPPKIFWKLYKLFKV